MKGHKNSRGRGSLPSRLEELPVSHYVMHFIGILGAAVAGVDLQVSAILFSFQYAGLNGPPVCVRNAALWPGSEGFATVIHHSFTQHWLVQRLQMQGATIAEGGTTC